MFESLTASLIGFSLGAGAVWWAGTKLTILTNVIAERTAIGQAFAGLLLLGGATSLPELATTITASSSGAADLAGSNLLGGVAMQLAILAIVDVLVLRGKALTFVTPRPVLLIQGVLLVLMIAVTIAAIATGELVVWAGVGVWSVVLAGIYLLALATIYRYEGDPRWEPTGKLEELPQKTIDLKDEHLKRYVGSSTQNIVLRLVGVSLVVLVAGYTVSRSAEALVEQTGLRGGFIGATLLALATSLPELSTTWSAVRIGAYGMAVAEILGTNSLEIALFLPADLCYRRGSIIDALGNDAIFLGALGIVITCLYLWGLLERRDKTIFGMGIDSALVLLFYLGGMTIYYFIA